MRLEVLASMAALGGSFLVSYVRARAQSLGFTCDSGLFARPERVVLTVAGLVAAGLGFVPVLSIVVGLLAVATNFTALQRIYEVWAQARTQRRAREAAAKAPTRGETSRP
jgi:CDP-diacylglycerol--glycerol-3-phosphate 3-phosphatidyltransferase